MTRSGKIQTVFFGLFLSFALLLPVSAAPMQKAELPGQTDWSRVYFLGESTTAHLRRRGTLLGQYAATNVFSPDSGTLMLSSRTLSQTIRDSETNAKISIASAIEMKKPPVLILSFGLNGIVGFHAHEDRYLRLYRNLIGNIRQLSPDTEVFLQTIYPVAKNPAPWKFSATPGQINQWIASLNRRLAELADSEGLALLDTAALAADKEGYLRQDFSADGIHLTAAGYEVVLQYIGEKTEELFQ